MTIKRAIVVGGGISGLSLAFFLKEAGVAVTLLEKEVQTGGVIRTSLADGFLVEHGPNSTLQKPSDETDALGRLLDRLGLVPQVASATAARRFVQKSGRLVPLPASPGDFIKTPLFSPTAKLGLLMEPFRGRARDEESVSAFVTRRLGAEFLHWAVDPFISGVYAGDPERLSIRAATPRIYALEKQYGSLIKGAVALRKKGRMTGMPKGRLISFAGGMEKLVATLRAKLTEGPQSQVQIITDARVKSVIPAQSGGWQVDGDTFQGKADGVFLAIPAYEAAPLLRPLSDFCADTLDGIRHAPVVSMALGFARSKVDHPLDGFGFLVPKLERSEFLGCLFSATLFPGRARDGYTILTVFLGGTRHPTVVHRGDSELLTLAMTALTKTLGVHGLPQFTKITRYERAIAQYELGHINRLERLQSSLESLPGFYLCGNFTGGVSVADRVLNSERLAKKWSGG